MSDVTYEIVEHDGGWAYKVDGVFSEPFPTHAEALQPRGQRPRSKKFLATWKLSSARMTRVSGTRKRPAGAIARTPSSGTEFKLFISRRARLTDAPNQYAGGRPARGDDAPHAFRRRCLFARAAPVRQAC
jgi:hypothetical protein